MAGVLEVQAAFDLYLMEVRRLEDAAGLGSSMWGWEQEEEIEDEQGIGISYPSLKIIPGSGSAVSRASQAKETQPDSLRLQHADLTKHLARRGAAMDHYEHPLTFARSAMQSMKLDRGGFWGHNDAYLDRLRGLNNDYDVNFLARIFSLRAPPSVRAATHPPTETLSTALFDTTTAGGILALARLLLTNAPRLEHLSLVSYLQLVLWREDGSLLVPSLRSLALSLFSNFVDLSLYVSPTLHGAHLNDLKQLYLSGHNLKEQKIACIAEMPGLKQVTWDLCYSDYTSAKE